MDHLNMLIVILILNHDQADYSNLVEVFELLKDCTEIPLFVRIREHVTPTNSAVFKHIESCAFCTNCDNIYKCFEIVKTCSSYNDLLYTICNLISIDYSFCFLYFITQSFSKPYKFLCQVINFK